MGIDLQANNVNLNDDKDPDGGPNHLMNFPVITSAIKGGSSCTEIISGTLNARANETFTIDPAPIVTSCVSKLTDENTKDFAVAATVKEYEPSAFVTVPVLVPFTVTDTLPTGTSLSSVTLPVIVRCDIACEAKNTTPIRSKNSFLMCI